MKKESLSINETLRLYWQSYKRGLLPFISNLYRDFSYVDEPPFWLFHADLDVPHKQELIGASAEGFSFTNANLAMVKCFGEAIERYYSFCPARVPVVFSTKELAAQQLPFVLPELAVSPQVGSSPLTVKNDVQISWYKAETSDQKGYFIPAQLITLAQQRQPNEPFLAPLISTGTASHTSVVQAKLNGLCEVIERDAFMSAYLLKAQPPQIDLNSHPSLQFYTQLCRQYRFELMVFDITNDTNVPCYWALLIDHSEFGPALTVGAKADSDPLAAITGSIAEAFHPRAWLRTVYAESFGKKADSNPTRIHTLGQRGLFWSSPKQLSELRYLWSNSQPVPLIIEKQPKTSPTQQLEQITNRLDTLGHKTYWVNLTPHQLEGRFSIIKAVVPTLQPLYLEEHLRVFQPQRLHTISTFYQSRGFIKDEIEWASHPHPFL